MPLRLLEATALVLLVLVWTGLRLAPAIPNVAPGAGETVLLGNDPWFHLHQTRAAVEHFPRILRWDVGTQYPEGSRVAASGLFHLGLAGVARLAGIEAADMARLTPLLAWSPVVLGASSILCLFGLAREIGGRRLAWVTVILRVAFPGGELERTLFGFGDQHAAEILLVTAALWAWVRWAKGDHAGVSFRFWLGGALAAVPVVVFLFTWFGAPLLVAILIAGFWTVEFLAVCQGEGNEAIRKRAISYFAGIFVITGGVALFWREGIMVPEALRFTLVALGLQVALLAGWQWLATGWTRRFGHFGKAAIMTSGAALLAVVFLSANPQVASLALKFLGPANRDIAEHAADPVLSWWFDYGLVLPWLFFGVFAGLGKENAAASRVAFAVIALWMILATLRSDFFYLTGALAPLAAAYGGLQFWAPRAARRRRWLPVASVVISLILVWPAGLLRAPVMTRHEVAGMVVATKPWREAMRWIRDETPVSPIQPTHLAQPWKKREGFAYPSGTGAVFTHWQYGNLVPVLADHVAVSARSRSPEFIDWFLEQEENASQDRLGDPDGVRYLVLDAVSVCDLFATEALQAGLTPEAIQVADGSEWEGLPLRSYGEPFRRSIGANLYLGDGSSMERYRLVYESREESFVRYRLRPEEAIVSLRSDLMEKHEPGSMGPFTKSGATWEEPGGYLCYSGQIVPSVKVFERVVGAVLKGNFSPGEMVSLELSVVVPASGRAVTYRRETAAGAEGGVTFRVPYATGADSSYRITTTSPGAREKRVSVTESEVATGAVLHF